MTIKDISFLTRPIGYDVGGDVKPASELDQDKVEEKRETKKRQIRTVQGSRAAGMTADEQKRAAERGDFPGVEPSRIRGPLDLDKDIEQDTGPGTISSILDTGMKFAGQYVTDPRLSPIGAGVDLLGRTGAATAPYTEKFLRTISQGGDSFIEKAGQFLFEDAAKVAAKINAGTSFNELTPFEKLAIASVPAEFIPGVGLAPDIFKLGRNFVLNLGEEATKLLDNYMSARAVTTSTGETFKITGNFGGTTTNKKGNRIFNDINRLIKNKSVRSVLDKVKTGELSRAQAAKILEESLGVTNLTTPNKNKALGFDVRGSEFSPIYDAYIKTIPQDDIFLTYPEHVFQVTGKKLDSQSLKKVGELDKIFKRVNSQEFLNIKLPDGTTMKDQPLDYQYYNAYIDSVPRQDHAAYSEFAKKYLNDFYKFRKSEEFNFRKPVKYEKLEGTEYIYDTRVGDKMKKAMSSEFKPLYDNLRKKVQSNIADIPETSQIKTMVSGALNNHLTRMINRAEFEGASFEEIAEVINNIDAKAISDIFTRKVLLENKVRALKTESLSSSLKSTDPQLFPELIETEGVRVGLIELSHIEDVAANWRASFDINNLFLASGKFNRDQANIDKKLSVILSKLDNIKPDSDEAKKLLNDMAELEQELVDKNLISKIGDRYFGVSKDTDFEKAILKKTQESVDMTRFFNKGGIVSIEEMIQPINAQR